MEKVQVEERPFRACRRAALGIQNDQGLQPRRGFGRSFPNAPLLM